MMTSATDHQPTDLREYIRVLRARKLEILVIAAVLVAATLFFSFQQTPVYEGEAKILVKPVQSTTGGTVSLQQAPNLDTERELILSQAVAQKVQSDLEVDTPIDVLLKNVKVQVVTDTEVLVVRYDDPDPLRAATYANGFAEAYIDFRTQQTLDQFQAAAEAVQGRIQAIQEQIQKLNEQIGATTDPDTQSTLQSQRDSQVAQLGVLQSRLLDLQASASSAQGAAQVVQRAEVPQSPVSPNILRNALLALVAGLALGVGFAFLRERLDDRIKSRHELERRLGAPVIAAVPKVTAWRRPDDPFLIMRTDPKSPVSEAYRTLATNIQYIASQQRLKLLMVTSSMGGEGKTTTSANLATALAQSGKRVILMSADLRRPRVHHFFGLKNDKGLANVLSNATVLSDVAKDPGITNLRLIAGGPIASNPAELLGSRRAAEFLQSVQNVADFIVIDTPPVLAVADASILAPLVDGTLFVMDAEHSSRSAMQHSRDQLENAGARIVGGVFNNFDPSQSAAYPYYYYNYYYQYYGTEQPSRNGDKAKLLRRLRRTEARSTIGFDQSGKR